MHDYQVTRAAVEVERVAVTSEDLELQAIDRQQVRFSYLSLLAITVSFVHMAAALALFSRAAWYERGAALAMTGLVDVATWGLAGYFDYARRRHLSRSGWIKALFGFALVISMFLNGAYLYANRPAVEVLPEWMSISIAAAFAVFVPMLIGVASLIRGELEDDRLRTAQALGALCREDAPIDGGQWGLSHGGIDAADGRAVHPGHKRSALPTDTPMMAQAPVPSLGTRKAMEAIDVPRYTCPHCRSLLASPGALGAAKRWGHCEACKEAH
jgi:hypothetical protein